MKWDKKYDWQAVDETKGWETQGMNDQVHKVTIVEHETGDEIRQTFNFSKRQTGSDRWKRSVDRWIERINEDDKNPSVL